MKLINKEDFALDSKVYGLLTTLEEAILNKEEFQVSVIITKLKQRKITFVVAIEHKDQPFQCQ